jgi:hypothetical protein
MTRKEFLAAASAFAIMMADNLGLTNEVIAAEPAPDPYDGGKAYPPAATVTIEAFDVPIGATEIHVPVAIDRETPNTVIAFVRVLNGNGGRADPDTTKPVIFRPGDPLRQTVAFKVKAMAAGNDVKVTQPSAPDGAKRGGPGTVTATAVAGATNEALPSGRAPLTFKPIGAIAYAATGRTIQFDDAGGPGKWTTALRHGRTQPGNTETGYYGTVDMGGVERRGDVIALKSRRLDDPVKHGSPATIYPFLAQMLSGHHAPETQFKYGSIEWEVQLPDRRGSWPALWLLPLSGWPPEIDVYEGFGHNGSWKFPSQLSTNLHFGTRNVRTLTRPAANQRMSDHGLKNTLTTEFHRFACTVDPDWITIFVDGVETMRYANPFAGQTWYPLMNVAVKAKPDAAYDDGSGEMLIRAVRVWRAE